MNEGPKGGRSAHVAQKSRYSAINGRTTRHEGYALSIKHRKRIEEAFGWAKTIGGMAQTVYRGVERVRARFIMTMTANNQARMRSAPKDTVPRRRLFQRPVRRHGWLAPLMPPTMDG